jgi:hypothetical protein
MESHPYATLEAMHEIGQVPTLDISTTNDPAFQHLLATVNDLQRQIQLDREESREIIRTLMRQINLTPAPVTETPPMQPTAKTVKL